MMVPKSAPFGKLPPEPTLDVTLKVWSIASSAPMFAAKLLVEKASG